MKPHTRYALPICLAALATPALAKDFTVTQQDKQFSERKITIKTGDTILFVNEDETTHNVHSMSEGFAFDLGAQAPGETDAYTFEEAGKVKVRCAIHPKMKIDVTVE